jgi:hypothetical protein
MKFPKPTLNIFSFVTAAIAAASITQTTAAVKPKVSHEDYVWIRYDCNNANQVLLVSSGQNFQETKGALSYTGTFEVCPGDFNLCAVQFPIEKTALSPDGHNRIPLINTEGLPQCYCTMPPMEY